MSTDWGKDDLVEEYYKSTAPLDKLQQSIEAVDFFSKSEGHSKEVIDLAIEYRDHLITLREWRKLPWNERMRLKRRGQEPRTGWKPLDLSV